MKLFSKRILAILVLLITISTNVSAADFSVDSVNNDKLNVYGFTQGDDIVAVAVSLYGDTKMYNDNTEFAALKEIPVDDEGQFNCTFGLSQELSSGLYDVSVTNSEGTSSLVIYHLNASAASAAVNELAATSTAGDALSVMKKNMKQLGFTQDFLDTYGLELCSYYLEYKPKSSDMQLLRISLLSSLCTLSIKSETAKFDTYKLLCSSKNILGTKDSAFFSMDDAGREKVLEMFRQLSGSYASFSDKLASAIFLSKINSCENASAFLAAIKENADAIALNIKDFEQLKYPERVISSLMQSYLSQGFSSVSQFKSAFAAAVKAQQQAGSTSSKGNGGFGTAASSSAAYDNTAATPEKKNAFYDIENHWSQEAVNALAELGIVKGIGNGEFAPDETVSRGAFAKMTAASFFANEKGVSSDFLDVADADWFAPYVYTLVEKGIIKGTADKQFLPYATLTRQDAAVILDRIITCLNIKIIKSENNFSFNDELLISEYAKDAVARLASAGVIKGMNDGSFCPLEAVSRSQAAQLLYNLLSAYSPEVLK